MSKPERFVFDTNVIVSALLFSGSTPGQAFFAALEVGQIIVSWAVLRELNDVFSRDKFDSYLRPSERKRFLGALLRGAALVEVTEEIHCCRDPKDDKFLELAIAGNATCIVTGDTDLVELNPFRGIPIITPNQFLKRSSR